MRAEEAAPVLQEATGWTETALDRCSGNEVGEHDDLEGLSEEQIEAIRANIGDKSAPANVQAEVNDQAAGWDTVWEGDLLNKSDPAWPDDFGVIPPLIIVQALLDDSLTFPIETGLGWDKRHPNALTRLSRELLQLRVMLLMNCEAEGRWPGSVPLLLSALLLKPDGWHTPVGYATQPPRSTRTLPQRSSMHTMT